MGEAVHVLLPESYRSQQASHPFPNLPGVGQAVDGESLADGLADTQPWVEGGKGVLKNHLQPLAERPHPRRGQRN